MAAGNQVLKKCSICESCWKNLDDLLQDDSLVFNGYQPFFTRPDKGCFLFTHEKEDCGTTLSIEIWKFKELLGQETNFFPFKPGENPDCELRCIEETDLMPCAATSCNGNVIRQLMQIVKKHIPAPADGLSGDEIDSIMDEE